MKIIYISQFFDPEVAAAAKRCFDHSKIWVEKGIDVEVWTSFPNFPTGKLFPNYKVRFLTLDKNYEKFGIRVLRNYTLIRKNSSFINRFILYSSFCIALLINILSHSNSIKKSNLILGTSGTIFSAFTAFIISIIFNKKFIFELRDITSLQILATNGNRKNLIYYIIKWLELYVAKRSVFVVCVTDGYKSWLMNHGINKCNIKVIPNGIMANKKYVDRKIIKSNKNKIIISYFGTIGVSQDIPFWIKLIKKMEYQKDIEFLFLGDGPMAKEIDLLSKNSEIINYYPTESRKKINKYYEKSDICIVSLIPSQNFKHTIPSKLFDIMSYSKPILYHGPKHSDILKLCNKKQIIINLPNEINDAENFLLNSFPSKRAMEVMGKNGKNFVNKNFSREVNSEIYRNLFYQIDKNHR